MMRFFFFKLHRLHRDLHSFPTRRSSDLISCVTSTIVMPDVASRSSTLTTSPTSSGSSADRKSTRLNSSHVKISYAVFCLKKKKNEYQTHTALDTRSPNPHRHRADSLST